MAAAPHRAGVVKLADARDSKSRGVYAPCGFDSHLRHQCFSGGLCSADLEDSELNEEAAEVVDAALANNEAVGKLAEVHAAKLDLLAGRGESEKLASMSRPDRDVRRHVVVLDEQLIET